MENSESAIIINWAAGHTHTSMFSTLFSSIFPPVKIIQKKFTLDLTHVLCSMFYGIYFTKSVQFFLSVSDLICQAQPDFNRSHIRNFKRDPIYCKKPQRRGDDEKTQIMFRINFAVSFQRRFYQPPQAQSVCLCMYLYLPRLTDANKKCSTNLRKHLMQHIISFGAQLFHFSQTLHSVCTQCIRATHIIFLMLSIIEKYKSIISIRTVAYFIWKLSSLDLWLKESK